jgi:flagellar basal-body rod protein FlgC
MVSALDISASALSAQRLRMSLVASNLANASTTRDELGRNRPYQRLEAIFAERRDGESGQPAGVDVPEVRAAADPWRWVQDPDHPDAVSDPADPHYQQVLMPNISPVYEMVDMMLASRAYEANLAAMEVTKSISSAALRIIA